MQYQIKVPFPSKLGARLEDRALASNSAKPVQDDWDGGGNHLMMVTVTVTVMVDDLRKRPQL